MNKRQMIENLSNSVDNNNDITWITQLGSYSGLTTLPNPQPTRLGIVRLSMRGQYSPL